jgi:hypothetical protein
VPGTFATVVSTVKRLGSSQTRRLPTTPRSIVPATQEVAGVPGVATGGVGVAGGAPGVGTMITPSPGEAILSAPQAASGNIVVTSRAERSFSME